MTRIDVCRCPRDGHPAHDPQPALAGPLRILAPCATTWRYHSAWTRHACVLDDAFHQGPHECECGDEFAPLPLRRAP